MSQKEKSPKKNTKVLKFENCRHVCSQPTVSPEYCLCGICKMPVKRIEAFERKVNRPPSSTY